MASKANRGGSHHLRTSTFQPGAGSRFWMTLTSERRDILAVPWLCICILKIVCPIAWLATGVDIAGDAVLGLSQGQLAIAEWKRVRSPYPKVLIITSPSSLSFREGYPRVNGPLGVAAVVIVLTRLTLGTTPYTPSTISLGLLVAVGDQSACSLFPSCHHHTVLRRAAPQRKYGRFLLLVLRSKSVQPARSLSPVYHQDKVLRRAAAQRHSWRVPFLVCCFESVGVVYILRRRRSREVKKPQEPRYQ